MKEEIDWKGVKEEVIEILREYIRIDTTNPPGREEAAARFLASRIEREGIKAKVYRSAP